jgi:hypothetical protein
MFIASITAQKEPIMDTTTTNPTSAVAATVTAVACAWFLVAAASMVASPTDAEVARHARITVQPGAVMPEVQRTAGVQPDAHFTITVQARRA